MGGLPRGPSVQRVPAPQPVAHLLRSATGQVVERSVRMASALRVWVSQNPPQSKEGLPSREEGVGRAGGPLFHCLTEDTSLSRPCRGPGKGLRLLH